MIHDEKKLINRTSLKLRASLIEKTMSMNWEVKPKTRRNYLQKTSDQGLLSEIYKEFN
jgi:hypothetical protein